ncbi:MAG: TIGR03790 family protein, partial [Planctomycetota bacterium]|nr:TIGR03790 family protein [Planctomycetota bacterium]
MVCAEPGPRFRQDTGKSPGDAGEEVVPQKPGAESAGLPRRDDLVVLANAAVPDGVDIARYYCAKRCVPLENIITVRTSTAEEIDWPTFRNEILKPVSEFLLKRTEVLYLVPVYGIPLKIKEENTANDAEAAKSENTVTKMVTTRDYCCVDAELALVRRPEHQLDGWIPSEVFMGHSAIKPGGDLVLVCRLDGPSPAIAKRLIDDALYGEKMGIVGKAYIDVRGLDRANPYWSGDDDMRRAWEHIKSAGYDGTLDEKPELMDFPSLEAPALYWGWYAGDCKPSKDFKFVRGAVGAHLHSFAAHTIRAKDKAWVGPLLHYGIAATTGTVYEPL